MKITALILFASITTAIFAAKPSSCPPPDLTKQPTSLYFVPKGVPPVHFFAEPGGKILKKYVVEGDLLFSTAKDGGFICSHYLRKNKVATSGWLKEVELEALVLQPFESKDAEPQTNPALTDKNHKATLVADHLPALKSWKGKYRNSRKDEVEIYQKKKMWRIDPSGISGTVGTGNKDEDSSELKAEGALATRRDGEKYDPCDYVIIGFNNAIFSLSASQCMGSGERSSWPEFQGVYWK